MSFDAIPDLLADVLQEQRNTNELLTRLVETLAGLHTKVGGAARTATAAISKAAAPEAEAQTVSTATHVPATALTETTTTEPPPSPTLDYKADVAPTFARLLTAKGAPAVVALLATFGVKKGVELVPEQLADALAAATSALAE
ncbi:hypothetical protein [Accumulibacter sp.]|uniref:hypothetical protein n=1 Tax=Accumulibacter sp. TaxID=2053492 RepID=UPI0025E85DED|nr:hypothetical protein [Accumulibacter sp.]MCM8595153.1 hypothetical protein [Accumulibacter sp.]MCM8626184.1 hypothetical protein [Accumulibacter sp.]MDS4049299.1 hypothetical protein [Accumulibacter sp.]